MVVQDPFELTLGTRETDEAVAGVRQLLDASADVRLLMRAVERAMHGSRPAAREYVRGYRALTRTFLRAGQRSFPDYVVESADGQIAVVDIKGRAQPAALAMLESGALSGPFSPWVNAYGPGEGLLLDVVARVREVLPNVEPLSLPARSSGLAHWDVDDASVAAFIQAVRRELAASATPLDMIADTFGLNDTNLAKLFGVRRQAIAQWRADGVPSARAEKVSVVASLADLMSRKLKAERVPGIFRRPARAYGGLSMEDMIAADRHDELLDSVRASFDPSGTA